MRILIYSYNYYPEPIGIAPLMTELAEGLVKRGHEIHIITIGRKFLKLSGVNHVVNFDSFSYNSISFLRTIFKTRNIIRKLNPDILHAHFVEQYGWLASLAKFQERQRV